MGRSRAAKNKKLRENRQELVQNVLAGKIFCDMSRTAVMVWGFFWKTLLSDKNGDVDFGNDYGISRKEAIEKLKLSVQVSLLDPASWCWHYCIRILKRSSTLLGFPTREANRESTIRKLWSGFRKASTWSLLIHKARLPVLWSRENLCQWCLLALCPKPWSSGLNEFHTIQILSGLIAGVWPRLSGLVLDFLRTLDTAPHLERSKVRGGRTLTATQRWNLFIILTQNSLTIFRNWWNSFSHFHQGRKFLSAHQAGC